MSPASLSPVDSPEPKNTKTSNHHRASKSSPALLVYGPERGEDVLGIHSRLAEFGESVGVYVEPRTQVRKTCLLTGDCSIPTGAPSQNLS
jgi:hypothetical protein